MLAGGSYPYFPPNGVHKPWLTEYTCISMTLSGIVNKVVSCTLQRLVDKQGSGLRPQMIPCAAGLYSKDDLV